MFLFQNERVFAIFIYKAQAHTFSDQAYVALAADTSSLNEYRQPSNHPAYWEEISEGDLIGLLLKTLTGTTEERKFRQNILYYEYKTINDISNKK
jgi:hypothetical protein